MKEFFDIHHADSYLNRSIIRYGIEPIYVEGVSGSPEISLSKCLIGYFFINSKSSQGEQRTTLDDKNLNISPIPMGLIDSPIREDRVSRTYLAARQPSRGWKIGLTNHNLVIKKVPGLTLVDIRHVFSNYPYSQEFRNMVVGNYHTVEECFKRITDNKTVLSTCFSRNFFINREYSIYHKRIGEPIGKMQTETGGFSLLPEFEFFRELLIKDIEYANDT